MFVTWKHGDKDDWQIGSKDLLCIGEIDFTDKT